MSFSGFRICMRVLFRTSPFIALLLVAATQAAGATPRAEVARPTDFDPVKPGTSALQCKSSQLLSCGRQATARMELPKGSADRSAYRFVEEEFMFDTGVGIFLQTATAKDKTQTMEWRRRLAFRKQAGGGFQLLQVGMQYRCQGGDWGKVVCKPASSVTSAAQAGAAKAGAAKAAPVAGTPSAGPKTGEKPATAPAPSATASRPDAAGAAGQQASSAPGSERGGTVVTQSPPSGEPAARQPLDAQWRPLDPETAAEGAAKPVDSLGAEPGAQAGASTSGGAEIVTAQPSSRGMGTKAPAARTASPDAQQTASTATGAAAGAAAAAGGAAVSGAANASAQAGAAAGSAGQAAASAADSARDAVKGTAGAGQDAGTGQTPGAAGAADGAQADAAAQGAAVIQHRSGELGAPGAATGRGTPALIRLIPTAPTDVRSAQGFSPLALSTEAAVRLARPCEQPIDMCGQQVFDEVFSPDSYAALSADQVLRESFIYADNPVTSAVYLVTMVNLPDEQLAAERVRIEFVRRGAAWVAVSAGRQLRCRRGESAVPADWSGASCGN